MPEINSTDRMALTARLWLSSMSRAWMCRLH